MKLLNQIAFELKIYHEDEPNKFFTGNFFNKIGFLVLMFCRSESTLLDFTSFSDCIQGLDEEQQILMLTDCEYF